MSRGLLGCALLCGCAADPDRAPERCPSEPIRCEAGFAGDYPCDRIDLVSFVSTADLGATVTSDVWGWTDPATGREYALVGIDTGVAFVDLTEPGCPEVIGDLPATDGTQSMWQDLETFGHHLYVGSEAAGHGLQIFDLEHLAEYRGTRLSFAPDRVYDGVGSSHTVSVDPTGGLLSINGSETCEGGLHLLDLADPVDPTFAGCWSDAGYVHDAQCLTYRGPDTDHQGARICVLADGASGGIGVIDVSDPARPVEISDLDYLAAGAKFSHQGWFTEDQSYFLLGDELDEATFGVPTTTYVFDLRDLERPRLVGAQVHDTTSIDHQLYVKGGLVYQSNYTSGLRILDLAGVASADLEEVAFFDVYPPDDAPQFLGTWSHYPWLESGVIPVTSTLAGLFVVEPTVGR